jgi:hypothetical protein
MNGSLAIGPALQHRHGTFFSVTLYHYYNSLQAEPARSVHNHSHLPLQNAWPVYPLFLYQQRQVKR